MYNSEIYETIRAFSSRISRSMYVEWEDLTQAATAKVLAYDGAEPDNLRSWLWRIVSNEAVNLVRQDGKYIPVDWDTTTIDLSHEEGGYAVAETRTLLEQAMRRFTQDEQNVVLARSQGFSVGETATILGMTPDTVKKHHYNVRRKAR